MGVSSPSSLRVRLNTKIRQFPPALLGVAVGVFALSLLFVPPPGRIDKGIDIYTLWNAGHMFSQGGFPYVPELKFYLPIWSMLLFAPLSFIKFNVVAILWALVSIVAWLLVMRKLEIDATAQAMWFLNPFFLSGLLMGSYDWLALVGILLPMQYGSWLLFLKPQVTIGYLAQWAIKNGILKTTRSYFLPVGVILLTLYLGLYRVPTLQELSWNRSLGFWGIPIGLVLLYFSFQHNAPLIALAAAPFLSPYVAIQSWAVAMLGLTWRKEWLALGLVVSWVWFTLYV